MLASSIARGDSVTVGSILALALQTIVPAKSVSDQISRRASTRYFVDM